MKRQSRHRFAAYALLAMWIYGASLPLLQRQHANEIDIACGDVGWRPPGPAKFQDAVRVTGDGHCGVCHLQRSFRNALLAAIGLVPTDNQAATIAAVQKATVTSAYHLRYLAPRAPPAL